MQRLNQQGIDQAKRVLLQLGTEIKMSRLDEGGTAFLKPISIEHSKLILGYIQHLEDEINRRVVEASQATRMGNKFGVAVSRLDQIKNTINDLPDMKSDMKVSAIKDVVDLAFEDMDKL